MYVYVCMCMYVCMYVVCEYTRQLHLHMYVYFIHVTRVVADALKFHVTHVYACTHGICMCPHTSKQRVPKKHPIALDSIHYIHTHIHTYCVLKFFAMA